MIAKSILAALGIHGTPLFYAGGNKPVFAYGPVHKPEPRPFGGLSTRKSFTIHGVKVQSAFTRPKP